MLRKLLDFLRGTPDAPGAAPPREPDEQGPIVPVGPPTSGQPPAMEIDAESADPTPE